MRKVKRNNERIELPNGCSCSQLTVHPCNWDQPEADITGDWYIHYRFYAPGQKGKACPLRGMNDQKTLFLRQQATKVLRDKELQSLKAGYNPLIKKVKSSELEGDYVIHPNTPLSVALEKAFKRQEGTPNAKRDLKSSLKYLQLSILNLNYQDRPVSEIKKRHILNILENCTNIKKGFNNQQFNHYLGAMLQLYKVLLKYDTVEYSPARLIEQKQHITAAPSFITVEQRQVITRFLKKENYRFWNFVNIFFHSGARLSEMSRLQGKHVDLRRQTALYYVKKREVWAWVERPIPDTALPFWCRALKNCGPAQYVFAKDLLPGDTPVVSEQYTRRWRRWIKVRLGLNVDIYDLKHTHTTEVMDVLDNQAEKSARIAAKINAHTSTEMVEKVYDLKNKQRKDDKIKRLPIKFA